MRRLIPYAGYEPSSNVKIIPVDRARELRATGLSWKLVAWELTLEFDREVPFTGDAVYTAVARADRQQREATAREKETAT